MIKLFSIPTIIFISIASMFVNCSSSQSIEEKKEEPKKVISDSQQVASALSKYVILPPDTDYTGDYVDKYPNGVIRFSGNFRFGKRHGQWMAFHESGEIWSECFYNNGKREGSSKVFFPTGKLQYSGWFKNDLRDSIWVFFDETGKEIDKRAYREDEETGLVN